MKLEGRVVLVVADITCLENAKLYNEAYNVVSQYRKSKADRFKMPKDKHRCVASGLVLNTALKLWESGDSAGFKETQIQVVELSAAIADYDSDYDYAITTVANGKPVFANHKDVYFNISHSGKYVVCAVSDCEIGVDIEGNRAFKENVAKRFFSQEEFDWINGVEDMTRDEKERKHRFFRLWTLKEAYAKLTGEGIALSIGQVHFDMDSVTIADNTGVTFKEFLIDNEYHIAMAKFELIG